MSIDMNKVKEHPAFLAFRGNNVKVEKSENKDCADKSDCEKGGE